MCAGAEAPGRTSDAPLAAAGRRRCVDRISDRASRRPSCAGLHGACCGAGRCRPCRRRRRGPRIPADATATRPPRTPRGGSSPRRPRVGRASAARRVPLKRRPPPSPSSAAAPSRSRFALDTTRKSDTAERLLEADAAPASEGEGALELVLLGQIDPLVLPAAAVEGPRLHALELEREPRPHLLQPRLAAALVLGEYVPADARRLTHSRSACAPKFPRTQGKERHPVWIKTNRIASQATEVNLTLPMVHSRAIECATTFLTLSKTNTTHGKEAKDKEKHTSSIAATPFAPMYSRQELDKRAVLTNGDSSTLTKYGTKPSE